MANMTNFKPGETLTAEALNQAFNLVGARADAVIGIAQEAKEDAAEALARVDQATERVPELIEKVEEIEEVIPNLATTEAVATAQAAAESYADTVGVNTATTAKAYTDTQVDTIEAQIEALSSELTAQSAEIDEVTEVLGDKADADSVYTKDETYTKAQADLLYDVLPQLSSGTVIAQIKTPAGTKPLYAPQGGSGGSSVSVNTIVTTGTHIADLTVDGVTYELYAPAGGTGGVTIEEVIAEIEEHLEAYSTTTQVTASLELKADKATTYTKTEVDNALSAKADSSAVYTKTEVDAALAGKADTSDVVNRDEIISLAGRKTAVMGFSKECFYKVVGQGTTYGFQYNDGVFTPENRGVQNTTATIQLQVYARSASAKIPIDVYVDSENNYDKCIVTWDTTTLCTISGEQKSDAIEVQPNDISAHTLTISYLKDQSSDKGIDACAVRIGTPCIESAGGGGDAPSASVYSGAIPTGTGDYSVKFTLDQVSPPITDANAYVTVEIYLSGATHHYISAMYDSWSGKYEIKVPEEARGDDIIVVLNAYQVSSGGIKYRLLPTDASPKEAKAGTYVAKFTVTDADTSGMGHSLNTAYDFLPALAYSNLKDYAAHVYFDNPDAKYTSMDFTSAQVGFIYVLCDSSAVGAKACVVIEEV